MNIFIIDSTNTFSRTSIFLEALYNNGQNHIWFCNYQVPENRILKHLYKSLYLLSNLFPFLISDTVVIMRMQHDNLLFPVAKFLNKTVVTDFYISLYDTYVNDRKKCLPKSRLGKKLFSKDLYALKKSDMLIFLNEAEIDYYEKIFNINLKASRHCIIPSGIVFKEPPFAKLEFFNKKRDVFNICYCGDYIPLHGLDKVINAIKIIKDTTNLNFHIYIWGTTEKKSLPYKQQIENLNLVSYITINNEWNNLKKWEEFIAANCDLTIGIFGDSQKAKTVLANKVIHGIAFKTPVLTAHSKAVDYYFNGKDDIFITENTPNDIASSILEISRLNLSDISRRLENAYKIYSELFSGTAVINKAANILNDFLINDINSKNKHTVRKHK